MFEFDEGDFFGESREAHVRHRPLRRVPLSDEAQDAMDHDLAMDEIEFDE